MKKRIHKLTVIETRPDSENQLTLRAVEQLQQAKVIVYDAAVAEKWLQFAAPDSVKISVENYRGKSPAALEKLYRRLVSYPLIYGNVVRLRCIDPADFSNRLDELFFAQRYELEIELIDGIVPPELSTISPEKQAGLSLFSPDAFQRKLATAIQTGKPVLIRGGAARAQLIAQVYWNQGEADVPVLLVQNGCGLTEKQFVTTLRNLVYRLYEETVDTSATLIIAGVSKRQVPEKLKQAPVYLN